MEAETENWGTKNSRCLYIPLTKRVRSPYCKLRTEFFPARRKKGRSVTYSTDRENEVSKIFITSLGSKRHFAWRLNLAGRTVEYGPLN